MSTCTQSNLMADPRHIVVIDPSRVTPELGAVNRMALMTRLPLTIHMPCLFGLGSLEHEQHHAMAGIIILGSASSVNERLSWQVDLEAWLRPQLEQGVPTLGICYGHQMLAFMFGGRVDYVTPDQFKHVGVREVSFLPSPLWDAQKATLIVSHNEEVKELPSCMKAIGRSPTITVDALRHESLPIYGMQPHPEALPSFLKAETAPKHEIDKAQAFGVNLVKKFLDFAAATHHRQK